MAELTTKFKLVDEMSDKLDKLAQSGQNMADRWEQAGDTVNAAFEGISSGVSSATGTVDGVATSIDSFGNAAAAAAEQTDYWTQAVGNFDKSALEAIYSTEELVEMGLKSAEALEEQEQMFALCEKSAENLTKSMEATTAITSELSEATDRAAELSEKLADSDNVSAEAKEELARAAEAAAEAMSELTAAQEEAEAAMTAYDETMMSGTNDLSELEAAAERAGNAADSLAAANGRASQATEELSKATEQAAEEADNSKDKGVSAIEAISSALAAAGITKAIKEAAEAVYELTEAFSEAESTVVLATGATGDALDSLTDSMMNAYAASKTGSLADTAAAVGEINTRLGYTGDILTETTELFLDFADVTGGSASTSVRSVTQLMNQWNIPATEMESTLNKLVYAGQASGISVDTLSSQLINNKAILDQLGFSLDEAIAMFMNFELAGTNATAVMTGFRTALASGDISSLEELYEVFDEIASGAMSAAEASELFGTRAGPAIVSAVQSGTMSLDGFVSSLEATQGTLSTTATAAQTLDEKWEQATNNIGAAFTTVTEPAIDGVSSKLAELVDGMGDFLNEHPAVTKAITVIGVGLGTVAVALAGVSAAAGVYNAVIAISTAVSAAFGETFAAAFLPVTAAVAGVAALATAIYFVVDALSDANDETEGMTATTRAQYYELEELNSEYEQACKDYGELSEEALSLRYRVDSLTEAYEANKKSLEELQTENDELCDRITQTSKDYNDAMADINSQEAGTLSLIQRYEELATKTSLTTAEAKELSSISTKLGEAFPELADGFNAAGGEAANFVNVLEAACKQEAEEQRLQQSRDSYVEALQEQAELEEQIAETERNRQAAITNDKSIFGESAEVHAYKVELEDLYEKQAENEAELERIRDYWGDIAEAEDTATGALEDAEAELDALAASYEQVYQSALESFEGQFGLFDEASTKSDEYLNASVSNAQAALDSQLAYWDTYNSNLEVLTNYAAGLSDTASEETKANFEALVQYASDGSEQAAGFAASLAKAIESGDKEAVENLANTYAAVKAKQEEVASTTGELLTDFSAQMDEIVSTAEGAIEDMNLSDEAEAAAKETLETYAAQITKSGASAVTAAKTVAAQVSAALAGSTTTTTTVETKWTKGTLLGGTNATISAAHANGTTNAENMFVAGEEGHELIARPAAYANGTTNSTDFYIAGENGPELIVGQQGSTVFPTSETDRLIDSLSERRPLYIIGNTDDEKQETRNTEQVKKILLEIAGSGAIEIANNGSEVDKETVIAILYEYLKPVLMSILQTDIYEEGVLSYDY